MDGFDRWELSPGEVARQVLEESGVPFREEARGENEENGLRFALCQGEKRWETVCRFGPELSLIYGIYPFRAEKNARTLERVNRANASLARGGFFLANDRILLRVSAALIDGYSARESFLRALEYHAAAMTRFWQELEESGAGGLEKFFDTPTPST